jgi:hypothetical protein
MVMRTGWKLAAWVLAGVMCVGLLPAFASARSQRKTKKPQLPALPSGPRGPVPQIPLDSIPAVAPQVSYQNGQLTIVAPNSTLGDILRAVRKTTAADIEIPANANERVVTRLGPGPARDVVAELLNGSRFNYVLLGSPADANLLTRVVLVAKSAEAPAANEQGANPAGQPGQPGMGQPGYVQPPQQEAGNVLQDNPDAEAAEENPDENADQNAAEAEQPQPQPGAEQPGVKTPQQMLQEMQQRQLQMQQQQPPGQAPIPGGAVPPQRPPEQ